MNLVDTFSDTARFTALRRDLHAHPELGFEEHRTAGIVAEQLREWGIEVHTGVAGTGVVGVLRCGDGARSIGLRADLDALPLQEANQFAHRSQHAGRMHACGHDGHTAMLLAAARHLAKHRDFDGTVYLIFQPAEEGGGGAREMLKDGLLDKFPMDAVYGMHNWPGMGAGQFAVCDGPAMASSNEFKITITGRGSHAAQPQNSIDPVPVACQMVQAFQTIVTRNKKPADAAVISVTMIHTGEATNVVPDTCEIEGTVRTFTLDVLDLIERRMREIAQHTGAAFGAGVQFDFHRNYPPTINHTAEVAFLRSVMRELVGEANTLEFEPAMTAEDFSYFLQARPGAYFVIGNGDGSHRVSGHGMGPCTLHNPNHDFNDELIAPGAALWVRLAERFLAAR